MKILSIVNKSNVKTLEKLIKISHNIQIEYIFSYDFLTAEYYDLYLIDDKNIFFDYISKNNLFIKRSLHYLLISNENTPIDLNYNQSFLGVIDLNSNIANIHSHLNNTLNYIKKLDYDKNSLINSNYYKVYSEMFSAFSNGVLFIDKKGNIIDLNPVAERILNITKKELMKNNLLNSSWKIINEDNSVIKPEDYPVMKTLKTKKPTYNNIIGICSEENEKIIWLKMITHPYFNDFGELEIIYAIFKDITIEKKRTDQLKIFESIVKYSPISLVVTDINGNIELINSRFEEISGYTNKDLIGKNPGILKNPDYNYKIDYKEMWKTLLDGNVWRGEFNNLTSTGKPYIEDAIIAPLKNNSGKITHFLGLKEDITDLKKVQKELENTLLGLEKLVENRTESLEKNQKYTLESLAILAEYRDNETGLHIKRTKFYMKLILETMAKNLNYSYKEIQQMWNSAPLHDIGKVAISDNILLKPGKLTSEEFEIMKKHVIFGYEALINAEQINDENEYLKFAKEITLYHHEKWNGTGYPHGLKEEKIPFSARIMALVDVYDALRSKRPYKLPFNHEKAVEIIKSESGKHFDPEIVNVFLTINDKFNEIYNTMNI